MNDAENLVHPVALAVILEETARLGFTMASEPLTGSLLRTLVQSKVGGAVLELGDARLGLTICEDIWTPGPPASDEALAGAPLILNASASPYHAGKGVERERDALVDPQIAEREEGEGVGREAELRSHDGSGNL